MGEEYQTAAWALEATSHWFSGRVSRCHELLLDHLNIHLPFVGAIGVAAAGAAKDKSGRSSSPSSHGLPSDGSLSSSSASDSFEKSVHESLSRLLVEQDFATLHNVVMTHFLSRGESLPFKWPDLVQLRMSGTVEVFLSLPQRYSSSHASGSSTQPKASAISQLPCFKPSPHSKLDPHSYTHESIDASLAALGPVLPLAWYNLAVLQTVRNHHRTALKTCDEILDVLFPPLVELNHPLCIKIGLLYLFLIIKLNYSTHPKHNSVMTDMEKVLSHRISATTGSGTSFLPSLSTALHLDPLL